MGRRMLVKVNAVQSFYRLCLSCMSAPEDERPIEHFSSFEDAVRAGWDPSMPDGWLCPDCSKKQKGGAS